MSSSAQTKCALLEAYSGRDICARLASWRAWFWPPPPVRPKPLTQDGLLGLFSSDVTGRDVVLEPATMEDMCGASVLNKPSLEVIYDEV